ncbi:MAG: hypothetical protein RL226_1274, partial [Bacteroidota bacterium]
MKKALTTAASVLWASMLFSQLVINEGSNRNFSTILDENEEAGDWIELYNPGPNAINLNGWSLSDDVSLQDQWTFSNYTLESGQFLLIFCSGKDRYFSNPFVDVLYETEFTPTTGWNEHEFDTPYYWDGTSDLIVNTCSYSNSGYITNSSFFQTETSYISTVVNYQDGSDASCS